jgi:shikimate kinase
MKIILLTGIPGMGKTKIGNHLKNNYDFYHIDIENPEKNSSSEFINFRHDNISPELLIKEIIKRNRDAVITWGFYPVVNDYVIKRLQDLGAKMIWLDGNRDLAKKFWKQRDDPISDERLFDMQIQRINNHDIQGIFSPSNYDPFDYKKRKHKDLEIIIKDLFSLS